MPSTIRNLQQAEQAATAPLVALSLFFLVGMGGVAFDYARLASMDTELQQAADFAALAAATQLDRSDNAISQATAAITGAAGNRLAANFTKFANDRLGNDVLIENITFCSEFDDTKIDDTDACDPTTDPNEARFVMVTTTVRTANYALTPVVGAFSGSLSARAVAGLESKICNVAPLFVCTTDATFPDSDDVGKGILMKHGGGGGWAPGNYGLLDFNTGGPGGNNAVIDALLGHGLNGCQGTPQVDTETGVKNVTDAINTRFDVYGGSPATRSPTACNLSTGAGCPAENTGKDMVLEMTYTATTPRSQTTPPADPNPSCGTTAANISYGSAFARNADAAGFRRDGCHYSGTCQDGYFGDGTWDFAGYMAANHPGVDTATVPAADTVPTRYEVYLWELDGVGSGRMDPRQIGPIPAPTSAQRGQVRTWTWTKQCRYAAPVLASTAYPEQKDRRILPVVAANCDGLAGKGNVDEDFTLIRVFDVLLTEPSLPRSSPQEENEIYGEVIGPAETVSGGSGFQYYARSKPYLVR